MSNFYKSLKTSRPSQLSRSSLADIIPVFLRL